MLSKISFYKFSKNILTIQNLSVIVTPACRGRSNGGVAQLARAFGSYPKCHRFESSRRYQTRKHRKMLSGFYGPLVKWLRHRPFTAVTRVRVSYGSPQFGGLAQLVRAPASHAGGHWFESSSLHQTLGNQVFPRVFVVFAKTSVRLIFVRNLDDAGGHFHSKNSDARSTFQGFFVSIPAKLQLFQHFNGCHFHFFGVQSSVEKTQRR